MGDIVLTQDVTSMREQVQKAVVEVITKGLQDGTVTEERAKNIAKMILEKLPEGIIYQEFITILPKLDDDYQEVSPVIIPIMEQYEAKMRETNDIKITELIKDGKIDEALNLTNQAIEKERDLS